MSDSKIARFSENSVILREGEVNSCIYKIIKGHAEVYVGYGTEHETLVGVIGPQSCFGEFGLLLHEPAIHTIVAFSELYALQITENEMDSFIMENNSNVIAIMRNMAKTMMVMRTQIRLLLDEIEAGHRIDEASLAKARKAMRGYGMYRSIEEAKEAIKERI